MNIVIPKPIADFIISEPFISFVLFISIIMWINVLFLKLMKWIWKKLFKNIPKQSSDRKWEQDRQEPLLLKSETNTHLGDSSDSPKVEIKQNGE